MPPRVLVTGGAGYVGSHVAKALLTAGFEPVVLDHLRPGRERAARFGPVVRGSTSDGALVARVLAEHRIEAVVHLAASSLVRDQGAVPHSYFANNVAASVTLVGACLEAGVRAFALASTCTVYGAPDRNPVAESCPLAPIHPYGESKRIVERMLEWYGKLRGLRWASLRTFNVAGADEDGELGEDHDPETHLVPVLIQSALGRRGPFTLLGDDHPTPDGTCVRDYVHVSDLADAYVSALRYLLAGGEPRAFNVGSGVGTSVRDLVRAVEKEVGRPVPRSVAPRSPADPAVLVADSSLAQRELGWKPARSSIDRVVASAARWEARRPGGGS